MSDTYPVNNRSKILCAAENHLNWFDYKDLVEYLTGTRNRRLKAVEYQLPRLVAEGKLKAIRHGRKLVYRINHPQLVGSSHIEHDLMCTKLMLLFAAQNAGEVVSELFFLEEKERFGCVPDWAVLFPQLVLLCEFSTADNFRRTRLMRQKLKAYRQFLSRFMDYFDNDVSLLFIFEAPTHKVQQFANLYAVPNDTFVYFTDLASLLQAPPTALLNSPLFIWGGDGQTYWLTS